MTWLVLGLLLGAGPADWALPGFRVHVVASEALDADRLRGLARPEVVLWVRTRSNGLRRSTAETLQLAGSAFVEVRPPLGAPALAAFVGRVGPWIAERGVDVARVRRWSPGQLAVDVEGPFSDELAARVPGDAAGGGAVEQGRMAAARGVAARPRVLRSRAVEARRRAGRLRGRARADAGAGPGGARLAAGGGNLRAGAPGGGARRGGCGRRAPPAARPSRCRSPGRRGRGDRAGRCGAAVRSTSLRRRLRAREGPHAVRLEDGTADRREGPAAGCAGACAEPC